MRLTHPKRPARAVPVLPVPGLIAACALALPLAACNSGPSVSATNASVSEVKQKVAEAGGGPAATIEPGRWESTTTLRDIDMPAMPNVPPQVKEQMKARMGGAHSYVRCITAEDVKKAFVVDRTEDKNCKFDHFTLAGGKIDAAMNCNRGKEGTMAMTMTGTYAPEAYHMDLTTKAQGMAMGAMTMSMSVDSKRVGACKGTPDES